MAEIISIFPAIGETGAGLYERFRHQLSILTEQGARALFLFHGHDWCPDCPPAVKALEELARSYTGNVLLYSVYVGTKEEWRRRACTETVCVGERNNPFIIDIPHIQSVPTASLYIGLPATKVSLMANLTALPDNQDYQEHLRILESVLSLSEKYAVV